MKRLLVTGATGCVGRALVRAARGAGWAVRGLARKPPGDHWPGEEFVAGTVGDVAAVRAAASGCAAIVHLASWVHRVPRTPAEHDELRQTIVGGTRTVAEAAQAEGARLVLASTVAVFGPSHTGVLNDDSAVAPQTAYARAKLESEQVARNIVADATILRLALVYGPYDRGNFAGLIAAIDRFRAVLVGAGRNRKSLVYVDNLADRIVLCLAVPPAHAAGTWIAADSPAPTQRELMREIARALGRPAPPPVPRAILSLGAAAADFVATRLLGRSPTFHDQVKKLAATTEFSGRALDARLGYTPRIDLVEGVRRAVVSYRAGLR